MHKASYQEILAAFRAVGRGQEADGRAVHAAVQLGLLQGDGKTFTEPGRRLMEDGLLRGRDGVVEEVLRAQLLQQPAVRALVEGEWGHELSRERAVEIMRYAHPDSRSWSQTDFGRFFAALNYAGLVVYSKKKGTVRVTSGAPAAEPRAEGTQVSPSTPYRNKRLFASLIAAAQESLWWFDGHLDRGALQFAYEEAKFDQLREVRILICGRAALTRAALDDYQRLREELGSRGVALEWRTLLDRDDFSDKHDRWLRVGDEWWNVPPLSAVMSNKWGSLLEDKNLPPFADWWDAATEVTAVKAGAKATYQSGGPALSEGQRGPSTVAANDNQPRSGSPPAELTP